MTEPDTMVDVYRRLALALEPDLEERPIPSAAGPLGVTVRNDRGLEVRSLTSLGAWTAALEACQRRAAWRTMKAKRRLESSARFAPIGPLAGRPGLYVDDEPDGAA